MSGQRRYDQYDVVKAAGPAGNYFALPDEMEEVLRTFTPDAHDSEVIIDSATGTYYYLDRYGRRKHIPRTDVRAIIMENMNLPGHRPLLGAF